MYMNSDMLCLLTHIKNGQKSKKSFILNPKKKNCSSILVILWDEGYILGFTSSKKFPKMFEIFLKYQFNNQVIKKLTQIKKPSYKTYCSSKQLSKLNFNLLWKLWYRFFPTLLQTSCFGHKKITWPSYKY